ncbi:ABC transporter permease [Anaerosporobacter faecicola]|uniref:ABC transporter permease n=1 Tax=Anaerosporobacter faecicola TaxID=2718714 RepID=UPI001438842A|nr:FtsX-like permease family protein [Anaerosporobacter faecicola]
MWKKLFRQRKVQTIMIFLVILLCTALLNGAMTILTSIDEPYERLKKECHTPDITVFSYSEEKEGANRLEQRFKKLSSVEKVISIPYSYIEDDMYVGDQKVEAFSDLVKYDKEVYGSIRVIEGDGVIKEGDKSSCLIPACVKNEFDLEIGDTLTVKNPQGDINYIIRGVFVEPYSTSTAFDSAILIDEVPTVCKIQYLLKIYAKEGSTAEDVKNDYQEQYPEQFVGFLESVDDVMSNGLITINIVAAVFLAIGCIMLVVSCLIINFMIRHAMITDAKTIAVYKTIGYQTNDILKMYLTFYFVIVLFASTLGILVSKLISKVILSGIFDNIGENAAINSIRTGIPCIIIVLVFVLTIIFLIIRKTKNIKPVYALNGLQSTNTKKKKMHGNVNTAFSPFGIAIRNIVRDKKGIIGILITAIVTVFSINFAMISLDVAFSQKEKNDYWLGIDASDVIINVTDSSQYDYVKSIVEKDERVEKVLNVVQDERILFDWKKGVASPSLSTFIYDEYETVQLPVIEGHNPKTKEEIAISTKVADDFGKEIGDYIECYLGYQYKKKFLITGIFQTYYQLGDACRLRSDSYTADDIPLNYNSCSIYLKSKEDQKNFIHDMKEILGNKGQVMPRTEAFSSIMNMIIAPQIKGIPPVILLVFLIGGINIFCIVMLKNANNEKNNGIYKCIGYSTKDLLLSNLYYVGMIGLVAIIIAIPLTIASYGSIMSLALQVFGFKKYPITLNVIHLLITNVSSFLLFILSTVISSRSLHHVDVRDLIMD